MRRERRGVNLLRAVLRWSEHRRMSQQHPPGWGPPGNHPPHQPPQGQPQQQGYPPQGQPQQGYPPQGYQQGHYPQQGHGPPPGYTHAQGYGPPQQPQRSDAARVIIGVVTVLAGLFLLGVVLIGALAWSASNKRAEAARENQRAEEVRDQQNRERQRIDIEKQRLDTEQQRLAAEQQRQAADQQRRDARAAKAASAKAALDVDAFSRSVLACFHPSTTYTGGTLGAEYTDADGRPTQDGHVEFNGAVTGHGYSMDYVLHTRNDAGDKFFRVTPGKDTAFTKPDPACAYRQWYKWN